MAQINTREIVLNILLELSGQTEYSNVLIGAALTKYNLPLIHISEPTRQAEIKYATSCLEKKTAKDAMSPLPTEPASHI